jgi:hypothetical protein
MTYRELIDGLKEQGVSERMLDTEICGFEEGRLIFWANSLELDETGRPTLQGTDDV